MKSKRTTGFLHVPRKLISYAKPGGHFSFWEDLLLHEINYGLIEDWSYWLADRELGSQDQSNQTDRWVTPDF